MHFLKTKQGTFWIVPTEDSRAFWLGVDDQHLAQYARPEDAVDDVAEQTTGFYQWDSNARVKPPASLSEWQEGEPETWAG